MAGAWRLPGYVVEGAIGRGGTAEVWRGRVAKSGDPVALKRVAISDRDRRDTVRREAAVLSALDHPNLVRLHEVVSIPGYAVLVLDLAVGGTLADVLRVRGQLSPGEVITAVAPIAAAVSYAHTSSVVHGDLSAANVLFTEAGQPLLSDLGVARLLDDSRPVCGTPSYLDPAVADGAPATTQSDVFMLGGVALHALTGTPTWPDPTAEGALQRARIGDLSDVDDRLQRAGVPDAMRAVVHRALSADPRLRGTAAEFALDLRHSAEPVAVERSAGRITGGGHAGASGDRRGELPPTVQVGPRARPVLPRRQPPRVRPRRVLVGAAAGVVASVAAGAVLMWAPWSDDTSGSAPPQAGTRLPARSPDDEWLAALRRLDALRAKAFATRDATLLRRVYSDPQLRRQDAALLTELVPDGCGLTGVHTAYSSVTVRSSATRAVISVTARLPRSRLVCAGEVRSTTAPAPATRLRIELASTPDGVRITRQQILRPAERRSGQS